ncbi:MAG: acetoacetate--CoA ligase [Oceanococcaceae bacterium]
MPLSPQSPPLWTPSPERIEAEPLTTFMRQYGFWDDDPARNYQQLYAHSIDDPERFWKAVWDFCEIRHSAAPSTVLQRGAAFQDTRWFPDARLNFAENLLRRRDDSPAVISLTEHGERSELSHAQLYVEVEALASALRAAGVGVGDRVAGFLPNITATVIAMLATTSLGAVWSSCSPDFGLNGVLDRFGQIAPKVLFGADGYVYNGKRCHSLPRLREIAAALPSVTAVVVVPFLHDNDTLAPQLHDIPRARTWADFVTDVAPEPLTFTPLPFDHPLYIMYSSGTTGVPKCIVHGAGGTLLQQMKEHRLHTGIRPGDRVFYFTTCGWMMWNWLVAALASEATLILYDGSPFADNGRRLLDAIDAEGIQVFGTSAKYLSALEKTGIVPRDTHALTSLRTVLSTGSPLSHESFDYVYRDIKADVCLASISGGTDIISCFVLGNPLLPVYRGEIACRGLGMAVAFWDDDGQPVPHGKGELVCTAPFPSCPVGFWNDPDGEKFHDAYFAQFPGVWAHGDYGELTAHDGVIIHGRSDAVLNPGGVRIGTAEIYRQVEKLPEILESLVIGQHWQDDVRVVLFVVLRAGMTLDDALIARIKGAIRENTTPRHVPAKVLAVPAIPRTISGKIVELAVRKVVHGEPVTNTDALANPEALEHFRDRPELG